MNTKVATMQQEFEALIGKTFDAFFYDSGYWHFYVALRCTDGSSVVFTTNDVGIAKYFEVFPLSFTIEPTEERDWRFFEYARTAETAIQLWRHEWLEPTQAHPEMVGSPPHYAQYAGRGPAPETATHATVVLAGVLLECQDNCNLVISASDSAPFNVHLAHSIEEVEKSLTGFVKIAAQPGVPADRLRRPLN